MYICIFFCSWHWELKSVLVEDENPIVNIVLADGSYGMDE